MKDSGIYIVQLLNDEPMPVTRDRRYVDICAKVNKDNVKVGKAENFESRRSNYWKDFDSENVVFEPVARVDDIETAERLILRALKQHRKLSPKGGKLEWLEGISYEDVRSAVYSVLDENGVDYGLVANDT